VSFQSAGCWSEKRLFETIVIKTHQDSRSMSIQALKESLPEISDEAFQRTYRPLLGYETSRPRGGKKKAGMRFSIVSRPSASVAGTRGKPRSRQRPNGTLSASACLTASHGTGAKRAPKTLTKAHNIIHLSLRSLLQPARWMGRRFRRCTCDERPRWGFSWRL
jgi:hypothetical protein